ncbi:SNARE-like domain protein, partial [Cooperia oncophora]
GAVYDFWCGFFLCCVLTTGGSTLCYLFSEQFGREYVMYYFGQKLTYLQQKIDDNSNRLLPFLLFARIFPISPSWLLNIVAPFLNIPLKIFVISAFIGLAPYNFICVQAGYILSELRSWDDIFSTSTMLKLFSIALLPLAYAIYVRPQAQKHQLIATCPEPEPRKMEIV